MRVKTMRLRPGTCSYRIGTAPPANFPPLGCDKRAAIDVIAAACAAAYLLAKGSNLLCMRGEEGTKAPGTAVASGGLCPHEVVPGLGVWVLGGQDLDDFLPGVHAVDEGGHGVGVDAVVGLPAGLPLGVHVYDPLLLAP